MQFCQSHWDELRVAIDKRGLSHLVSSSGAAAMERTMSELKGNATLANFDPLLSAHWMICNQALKNGGLYLLQGDYCPLCELDKHANDKSMVDNWINGCTDEVLDYCISKGLKQKFV